jgi:hypothetical protein
MTPATPASGRRASRGRSSLGSGLEGDGGVDVSASCVDDSDDDDEAEVSFVPVDFGSVEAAMPDFLKVCRV